MRRPSPTSTRTYTLFPYTTLFRSANAAGWAGNLFARISFYDNLVHAFTAFAVIAALAYMAWTPVCAEVPVLTLSRFLKATAGGLILGVLWEQIGRASCRERVGQYV